MKGINDMSKVILSKTGKEYEITPASWSCSENALSFILLPNGDNMQAVENACTGNTTIRMEDAAKAVNAYDYVKVHSIELIHDFEIGGRGDDEEPITGDVFSVEIRKEDLETRVTDLEEAVCELGEIVGGE